MTGALARIDGILGRIAGNRFASALFVAVFALVLFLPGFFTLPVTDRDEARFAQASRQMVETGDPVDIRLGDSTRYKKPVGIYWLQSATRLLAGDAADREIWAYRLPSLGAAVAACLLTWLIALNLMGTRAAFLSGLLIATTITLGAEARIAKTDAVLLLTILVSLSVLARLHIAGPAGLRAWPFWAGLGASMLVKGPIGLMVVGLTVVALCLFRRDIRWLSALRPLRGLVLMLVIVLPWYLAITARAGWAFWDEALFNDFLSKIGEGQESHGAPPGSYAVAVWLTFWPAAILLPVGLVQAWRGRADPATQFLVAWALPAWIVFEIVSTKLFHYTLPLYPALAILAAAGWLSRDGARPGPWLSAGAAVILALGLVYAALPAVFTAEYGGWPGPSWILGLVLLAAGGFGTWRAFRAGLIFAPALTAGVLTLGVFTAVLSSLARYEPLWPSLALSRFAEAAPCPDPLLVSAGYDEASLLFLTRSRPVLSDPATGAARAMAAECAVMFVDSRGEEAFRAALGAADPPLIGTFEGFSMGPAEPVTIRAYLFSE
ncbi:glycosyl transferase [Rhodobacterales bacterium HKCCE2091]|nr:glycosyl transferase [Rhodobacterales bacterium HKCCE2091]